MSKLLRLVLLSSLVFVSNFAWAAKGDTEHVVASAGITLVSYAVLKDRVEHPVWWSIGIAVAAGLAKESIDDEFSESDLKYDAIGIGIALVPIVYWEF